MKFLERIFGRKPTATTSSASPIGSKSEQQANELIKVYDSYGRELQVTKHDWLNNVLFGELEKHRNDPDQLYSVLAQSLTDGFFREILPYAKHLWTIDPIPSRAATLLGVIYLELNQLSDAERTLVDHINKHGEEAYVLANLAKVYSKRGDVAKADSTLWRSLELDPNQENALGWLWALAKERGGEQAGQEALRKLAALPKSWRARLWIARCQLQQADLSAALNTYDEAVTNAPDPVPADMLMQMSGDLGNHGHLVELLKLVGPLFNLDAHGLLVGNNLIKANLDLGRVDHAKALVDNLHGLKRPDFQQQLAFWDTEIAKARIAKDKASVSPPVSITMLALQGPIWLAPNSPAASLFPKKENDASSICILGSTAETGAKGEPQMQMADIPGRIARGVTLFLCEQIHLRTRGLCQVLQPWITSGGFMLSGEPWDLETAVDQSKACQPQSDYIILTHLLASSRPFSLSFRLIRCIDGSPLDSQSIDLDPENLEPAYRQLAERVLESIDRHAHADPIAQPAAYQVPEGGWFNDYQLRLEQALAVRVAAMGDTRRDFLSGEHEIITGMLHLCLATPSSVSARIMLFNSLRRLKEVCPQIAADFRERIELLQKEYPPPEMARTALDNILAEVFSA